MIELLALSIFPPEEMSAAALLTIRQVAAVLTAPDEIVKRWIGEALGVANETEQGSARVPAGGAAASGYRSRRGASPGELPPTCNDATRAREGVGICSSLPRTLARTAGGGADIEAEERILRRSRSVGRKGGEGPGPRAASVLLALASSALDWVRLRERRNGAAEEVEGGIWESASGARVSTRACLPCVREMSAHR